MDSSSPGRPSPPSAPFALNDGLGASRTSTPNDTATVVPSAQVGNSQIVIDSSSSELSQGNLLGNSSIASSPAKIAAPTEVAILRDVQNTALSVVGDSADNGALPLNRPRRQELGGGHNPKKHNLSSQSSAPPPATNPVLLGSVAFAAVLGTTANIAAPPPSATPTSVPRETPTHAEFQRSEPQLPREFEQEIKPRDALYRDSKSGLLGPSTSRSAGPQSTRLPAPQQTPHNRRGRRRIPRPLAPHSSSNEPLGQSGNFPNPTNAPTLAFMRQEDAPSKNVAPYDNVHPINYPLAPLSAIQETLKPPNLNHPPQHLQHPYATIGSPSSMWQPPSSGPSSSTTNSAPQKAPTWQPGTRHGYAASGPTTYPSQTPSHGLSYPPMSINDPRALHHLVKVPSYSQGPQSGYMRHPIQHQTDHPPMNSTPSRYLQEGLGQSHATGPSDSTQIGPLGSLTRHSRGQSDHVGLPYAFPYNKDQNMMLQGPGLGAPGGYAGDPHTSMNMNQNHLQKQGHSTPQTFGDGDARAALHRISKQSGSRLFHENSQRPRSVNTEAQEIRREFTLRPLDEYELLIRHSRDAPPSLAPKLPELGDSSLPQVPTVTSAPSPSSSSTSGLDAYDDSDEGVLTENRIVPPELPPSVEAAYRKKCIQLKARLNEIEEANDASRLRIERLNRAIEKGRLERAFLLEQLAKRTSTNVEDSEGSPSPPPTPKEKPLRTKRGHRKPDFLSTDIGDGRAGSTFIQQGPVTLSPSSDAFSHTHPEMRNSTPQAHQAPKRHLPSNGTHASPYTVPGASRARPRSGFDIYCEENRELIIAEQGEDQIESVLARGWSTMEADRKAEYSAKFEELRRAYDAERAARHNPVDDDVEMGEDAATPGPATAAAPATGGFNPINNSRVE